MMAAFGLHGLNKLQANPKKSRKILIAPDAVAAEVKCLREARMNAQLENGMKFLKQQLLLSLSYSYKHILIQHPVSFHQDVFGKGDLSKLENRQVFYNYGCDGPRRCVDLDLAHSHMLSWIGN